MLLKLAARRGEFGLSTAPPHSAAPLRSVSATTPVVILLMVVLLIAILAHFFIQVDISPLPQLSYFDLTSFNFLLLNIDGFLSFQ